MQIFNFRDGLWLYEFVSNVPNSFCAAGSRWELTTLPHTPQSHGEGKPHPHTSPLDACCFAPNLFSFPRACRQPVYQKVCVTTVVRVMVNNRLLAVFIRPFVSSHQIGLMLVLVTSFFYTNIAFTNAHRLAMYYGIQYLTVWCNKRIFMQLKNNQLSISKVDDSKQRHAH